MFLFLMKLQFEINSQDLVNTANFAFTVITGLANDQVLHTN